MAGMIAIVEVVRRHWIALIAAAALALLIASPLYLVPHALGDTYRGIDILEYGSDEHLYLSRGKEALEGKNLGQPFLREGKEKPDPTQSYAEHILVAPVRILGLSEKIDIVSYFNVLNALGVFALVLLMYEFGLKLSGNKWVALGTALFAIGGYPIIEAKTLFYASLNIYGRSIFPYASSVPFFLFLNVLYRTVIERAEWKYVIAPAAALGFLCYIYFYAWTFGFALLGALGLIMIYLRDWDALKKLIAIGAGAALIGAYYFLQLASVYLGPLSAQFSYFYYSVKTHAPVMSKIGTATAALFAFVLWRGVRERSERADSTRANRSLIYIGALIAAGWISLNQQILTGRLLQYGHYYWYFIVPLGVIIGGALLSKIMPGRYVRYLGMFLTAAAILNLAGEQARAVPPLLSVSAHEQEYAPIMEKLEREPYGVIFTEAGGEAYSTLVTIYTNDDLYWQGSAEVHNFDIDRLKEALLVHLFLNHEARNNPIQFLDRSLAKNLRGKSEDTLMYGEIEGFYSGLDYYAYQRALDGGEKNFGGLREKLLGELGERYGKEFNTVAKTEKLLRDRGVRYLIWDRALTPEWDLSVFKNLRQKTTSDSITLYELQ